MPLPLAVSLPLDLLILAVAALVPVAVQDWVGRADWRVAVAAVGIFVWVFGAALLVLAVTFGLDL